MGGPVTWKVNSQRATRAAPSGPAPERRDARKCVLHREPKLEGSDFCAACKKIREKDDSWHPLEGYISRRSEARFSHSMCPECERQWYGTVPE